MHDKRYRKSICGSGKRYAVKLPPCLLFGKSKTLPTVVGNPSTFPVKKSGMGLQIPVTSAADKYKGLLREIYEMIGAVMGKRVFLTADHLWAVKEERRDRKKYRDDANDAKLSGIVNPQGNLEKRLFLRTKNLGSWMSVRGTAVTGVVLAAMEFFGFYVHIITLNPLTFKGNVTADCRPFLCVTRSAAAKEVY